MRQPKQRSHTIWHREIPPGQAWLAVFVAATASACVVILQTAPGRGEWPTSDPAAVFPPATENQEKERQTNDLTVTNRKQPAVTYDQALARYGQRRIQLAGCRSVPPRQMFKQGTAVMFDNRSAELMELRLDNIPYRIDAYAHRIVSLTSPRLPHTIHVDCSTETGYGRNIALLELQQ